uniref:LRRCT domain-containing protein n=1 Tax=Periophthalmus magnuspinnatus TaxID=409849 RepID=A0A3B4ADV1_9GOBI
MVLDRKRWFALSGWVVSLCPKWRSSSISGSCSRVREGWKNCSCPSPNSVFCFTRRSSTLERLYLYGNKIQIIQMGAFESLQNLLELKLHENLLTSLPALKVTSLGLTSLDTNLIASLKNLHYLDISMNQLVEVPPALRQDSLRGLIRLSLAGNPLRELKVEDFHKLNGLQELDLSGLNLQSIPQGLLDNFPRLVHLTAAENPFNCLCPLAWFSVWLKEKALTLRRPEETRCHFPLVNAGKMLSELEYKDFGCLHTSTVVARAFSQSTLVGHITTYPDTTHTNATSSPSLEVSNPSSHAVFPTSLLLFCDKNPFSVCILTSTSVCDNGKNVFVSCILGEVTILTLSFITCCVGMAFLSLQSFEQDTVSLRFKLKVAVFSASSLKVTVGCLPL